MSKTKNTQPVQPERVSNETLAWIRGLLEQGKRPEIAVIAGEVYTDEQERTMGAAFGAELAKAMLGERQPLELDLEEDMPLLVMALRLVPKEKNEFALMTLHAFEVQLAYTNYANNVSQVVSK
jgi:hypothetical protein